VAPHCWLIGWLTGLVVPQVAASYVHINVKELGSLWEKLRFDLVSGQAINFNRSAALASQHFELELVYETICQQRDPHWIVM